MMLTQYDIDSGRCYFYAVTKEAEEIAVIKRVGINIPGFKLAKDGKTPVRDDSKLDLITKLKKKAAPRKRYAPAKPSDRDFRG